MNFRQKKSDFFEMHIMIAFRYSRNKNVCDYRHMLNSFLLSSGTTGRQVSSLYSYILRSITLRRAVNNVTKARWNNPLGIVMPLYIFHYLFECSKGSCFVALQFSQVTRS